MNSYIWIHINYESIWFFHKWIHMLHEFIYEYINHEFIWFFSYMNSYVSWIHIWIRARCDTAALVDCCNLLAALTESWRPLPVLQLQSSLVSSAASDSELSHQQWRNWHSNLPGLAQAGRRQASESAHKKSCLNTKVLFTVVLLFDSCLSLGLGFRELRQRRGIIP